MTTIIIIDPSLNDPIQYWTEKEMEQFPLSALQAEGEGFWGTTTLGVWISDPDEIQFIPKTGTWTATKVIPAEVYRDDI